MERGILYVHADASVRDDTASLGYVICRHTREGEIKLVEASFRTLNRTEQAFEYDVQQAEYRACISAVRAATEYHDEHMILYNDNSGVVDAIEHADPIHTSGYFQHALYSFANWFVSWRVTWVPRDDNLAHEQARFGIDIVDALRDEGVVV